MPITLAAGAEPIPGYRLLERRGFGGYGEVWKVTAPGGLFKALKVIYGDLTGPRAEQEFRSLERIKAVRYPFLLSIERVEVVEGQLLIVTELADRSLMNRFQECCDAGQTGIPRQELIEYLRDAADALDYMSEEHDLQHLDVKPENLLLLGGRIKVADFGLVKDLMGTSPRLTGGVTPIYAPPEAFDGQLSRHSDQYSLAIVYQEMLTGHRPFPGKTAFQLAAQHTSAPPLLDSLPPADRGIIARALAKNHEQRFGSCRELIDRLSGAGSAMPATPSPQPLSPILAMNTLGSMPSSPTPEVRATTVSAEFAPAEFPGLDTTSPEDERRLGLRPTLFVGIGGLAGLALRRLRGRLRRQYGDLTRLPIFRLLYLDTDRASLRQAQQGAPAEGLTAEEVVHCPLFPTEHYRDQAEELLAWLDRRWLYGIPRSLQTEGLRPFGRLALVDHSAMVLAVLRQALRQVASPEARSAAVGFTTHPLRNEAPRVFLVAGLGGGTGGGMLVDLAHAVRQLLRELKLPGGDVAALLIHASGPQASEKTRAQINACATLHELQHWAGGATFPGTPERGLSASLPGVLPFDDCYLFCQSEEAGPQGLTVLADQLAAYLHFDATLCGGVLDRLRLRSRPGLGTMTWRSCGLSSLRFPRTELIHWASQAVCRLLLDGWREKATPEEAGRIEREVPEVFGESGLNEDTLLDHFHEHLPTLLRQPPEKVFGGLAAAGSAVAGSPAVTGSAEVQRVLGKIEEFLGAGEEPEAMVTRPPTLLERAFTEEAKRLRNELCRKAIDHLLEQVETAGARLRAAEVVQGVLSTKLLAEVQKGRERRTQLKAARLAQRRRLAGQEAGRSTVAFPGGLVRMMRLVKALTVDVVGGVPAVDYRQLWGYFCLRLEELIQEAVLEVLQGVQSRLTAWGLELVQARRKLGEFLPAFPLPNLPVSSLPLPSASAEEELFPYGASSRSAALNALLDRLPADLVGQLDRRFQAEVLDAGGGLWAMLTGQVDVSRLSQSRSPASVAFWNMISHESDAGQELRDELMTRARVLVGEVLKGVDLIHLLRERYPESQQLQQALQKQAQAARLLDPPVGLWQHIVLVVPDHPAAEDLRENALEALRSVPVTALEAGEALLVGWESAALTAEQLLARLGGDDPEVAELADKVLTRRDVPWAKGR
jgi:hypothetical protein